MRRLTYLIEGEMVLKYQLVTEDLDVLVTVRSDEDLAHMFDEIEHYEITGSPRMRAFLFPKSPSTTSSACSSPCRSPRGCTELSRTESLPPINMHKTQSSHQIRSHHGQPHPQYYHAPERLVSVRSVGRSDGLTAPPQSYSVSREISRGRCMHVHHFSDATTLIERQATLP